jgi:hypothetical protein
VAELRSALRGLSSGFGSALRVEVFGGHGLGFWGVGCRVWRAGFWNGGKFEGRGGRGPNDYA